MLRDALAVLPRSDDGIGTAIVGGLLLLLTFVFVPLWLVFLVMTPLALLAAPLALAPPLVLRGYYVRVVESGLYGETDVPSFVGWGGLYRAGAGSLLLSVLLLLPAGVLVGLGGAAGAVIQFDRVDLAGLAAPVYAVSMAFLAVLLVAYVLVFLYLRPAALARYAATGRVTAGLSPRAILGSTVSGEFATGWLVAMFVTMAGFVLVGPLVAVLVGFPLVFVVRVVAHNLYGRGAADAIDAEGTAMAGTQAAQPPEETDVVVDAEPDAGAVDPAREAVEAAPDVQVGRRVPLTASDVLSRAASRELDADAGENEDAASPAVGPTDTEEPPDRDGGDAPETFDWVSLDEE